MQTFDVVIIGGGPAGLSAGIYTARSGLKTLIINKGDSLKGAHRVMNYLGFLRGFTGTEFIKSGLKQVRGQGAKVLHKEVIGISEEKRNTKKFFYVKYSGGRVSAKRLVIATGTARKKANIPGEEKFSGKGVQYCALCDGPLYKGKKVAVIGNSDYALEEILFLLDYTKKVILISNGAKFNFSSDAKKKLKYLGGRIEPKEDVIARFNGKNKLESVTFSNGDVENFDGVFVAMGIANALNFADKLGLDVKENVLVADRNMQTNISGIYAVGDCIGGVKQIAKAVGDGCVAGVSIVKQLRSVKDYLDYSKI